MSRKLLLKELIAQRFHGNQAEFARAIKRSPGQVNQWLTGHRALGDAGARIIEQALQLGAGYFDKPVSYARAGNILAMTVQDPPVPTEIDKVVAMMQATDGIGRAMALAAVKVALAGHVPSKKNHSS